MGVKISDLTAASSVADANEFEINESGNSKKVTAAQIRSYATSGGATFSGNVGIGCTADQPLQVKGIIETQATNSTNGWTLYTHTDNTFRINYNGAGNDEATIESGGSLRLGTTTNEGISNKFTVKYGGAGTEYGMVMRPAADTTVPIYFLNASGGTAGSISITSSATSYNTSSDYRLKKNVQPMTGASARVQALNPVNFEWVSEGTRVDGFLAHEAQAVVPEAVNGAKDAMRNEEYEVTPAVLDDDGKEVTPAVMGTRSVPDMQGIDQAKLVPLLTAALQEAIAKIDDLETRITALEGA